MSSPGQSEVDLRQTLTNQRAGLHPGPVLAISGLEIKPPAPAKSWIGLGKHRAGLLEHYLITHAGVISDDFTLLRHSFMFEINRRRASAN